MMSGTNNKFGIVVVCGLALVLTACGKQQQQTEVSAATFFDLLETPVGDVDFPVGCNAKAAPLVERGVALLHHMMYDEAKFVFGMADDADPDCAMAYWGQAMTYLHPLWPDVPTTEDIDQGTALVVKSLLLGGHSDRENGYLETTSAYYANAAALTERERLANFEAAWRALSEANPDDLEARAFYSLALRATASPGGADLSIPRRAGALAESILEESPNHPGAHHYIIHAYDFPELAEKAEATADHYGEITPKVPHATHMMTHIYTRLGDWQKAIDWNTSSAESAWAICVETGEINTHYTHALDYLAYAYLQKGDDAAMLEVLETAEELQPPYSKTNPHASAYAHAALPARYALERRDWNAAIALTPRSPSTFSWETAHDPYVAITHFARAIGFARLGKPADAEQDIVALNALQASIAPASPYWAQQVEVQAATASAWQTYAAGNVVLALEQMQAAAEMEASTEKHPITPGEVLPTVELYGDMLLETGNFADALAAYETALRRSPRRYNSLYGAAKAALGEGDQETAAKYYAALVEIAGDASEQRASTREAQDFLN